MHSVSRREIKVDWPKLKLLLHKLADKRNTNGEYLDRLKFEINQVEIQGAESYWCDLFNSNYKYGANDNGLVIPWLLGMTPVDPLLSKHKIERSTDLPDIDVDCIPKARDYIKQYAADKYGGEYVCSVGTWMTYKFRLAIQDAARALGKDLKDAMVLTKQLPDDVDNLKDEGCAPCSDCGTIHNKSQCPQCGSINVEGITIGKLIEEYDILKKYEADNPEVVDFAVRMVGRIRAMGKHAGGIIITNQKLMGNVPMKYDKNADQWISMWTEGRNTQLSKLGYVKWDILGLKTLQYIHEACKLAEKTRGVKFNHIPWRDNNPEKNTVGWYTDQNGVRQNVSMDDPDVFEMINSLRVETLFQFETDVQKGVLANGVRDYYDLQVFNAMGHPGPIACIGSSSRIKVKDDYKTPLGLEPGDQIAFLDKEGCERYTSRFRLIHTGRKKIIKIKTRSGRVLYVTPDHRIRTDDGYKEAGELKIGSKVTRIHKEGKGEA